MTFKLILNLTDKKVCFKLGIFICSQKFLTLSFKNRNRNRNLRIYLYNTMWYCLLNVQPTWHSNWFKIWPTKRYLLNWGYLCIHRNFSLSQYIIKTFMTKYNFRIHLLSWAIFTKIGVTIIEEKKEIYCATVSYKVFTQKQLQYCTSIIQITKHSNCFSIWLVMKLCGIIL